MRQATATDNNVSSTENPICANNAKIMAAMTMKTELTILLVTEIIMTLILSPIPQILFYKKREQQDKIACCSRF